MTGNRLIAAVISLLAIAALGVIVLVAIGMGAVVFAVLVVAVIAAIYAAVRVARIITDLRAERDKLRYDFVIACLEKGVTPPPEFGTYEPIPHAPQIEGPKSQQGVSQIIFNPNALRESAVNLLLFSMRQCGPTQNRIASGPECAAAGVNGYTPRTWSKIVNEFLGPRYGVATQRGSIENGGGTYVPAEFGTVEALYHKVMLDKEVDALPWVER